METFSQPPETSPPPPPRVNVLGVGISAINLRSARDKIAAAIAAKRKGYICVTGGTRRHGGAGGSRVQEDFEPVVPEHARRHAHGLGCRWRGFREMDRVYGPDLMLLLCEWSQSEGRTHFLYGGAEGVAEGLEKFPDRVLWGTDWPHPNMRCRRTTAYWSTTSRKSRPPPCNNRNFWSTIRCGFIGADL